MYSFINTVTGKVHVCKSLRAASQLRDKIDREYGRVCTTYPRYVGEVK